MPNNSPWLAQLRKKRAVKKITENQTGEIAVVGGGIAGISTAYFLLRDTKHKVILIEATNIAHGATGHNAGFLAAAFERPFEELVAEFGLELAAAGQKSLDDTWLLLEEIITEAGLKTPCYRFTGYNGFTDIEVIKRRLAKSLYLQEAGLGFEKMLISESFLGLASLPKEYDNFYSLAKPEEIWSLLETTDKRFVACVPMNKGVMNSALFCEELVEYLETKYADRFIVLENTPVKKVSLGKDGAVLAVDGAGHTITVEKAVLCTNGFENITLAVEGAVDIDGRFHHNLYGVVGYMAGFLADENKPPTALSYLDYKVDQHDAPYFYLTRRPYEHGQDTKNLISIGGPEVYLPDRATYSSSQDYLLRAEEEIDQFVHKTYADSPKNQIDYKFQWHGLMGYTKNGVRLIGVEPCHERLLYNLGCNGIGLIPSIYGGWRIAQIIAGKKLAPSIFDPKDLRCAVPKVDIKI